MLTLRIGSSWFAMDLMPSASCLIFCGFSFSRCIKFSLIFPWLACKARRDTEQSTANLQPLSALRVS